MTSDASLSVAQVARRYRIGLGKVLTMIAEGDIAAVNVSLAARPQWRITPEALAAFEQRRAAKPKPTRRRKKSDEHVYKFF